MRMGEGMWLWSGWWWRSSASDLRSGIECAEVIVGVGWVLEMESSEALRRGEDVAGAGYLSRAVAEFGMSDRAVLRARWAQDLSVAEN